MTKEKLKPLNDRDLVNYAYHAVRSARSYGEPFANDYHLNRAEEALKQFLDSGTTDNQEIKEIK